MLLKVNTVFKMVVAPSTGKIASTIIPLVAELRFWAIQHSLSQIQSMMLCMYYYICVNRQGINYYMTFYIVVRHFVLNFP